MPNEVFDTLILSHTWWAYVAGAVLWLVVTGWKLSSEGSWQFRKYFPRIWRVHLTWDQWRRVATVALLAAPVSVAVTWGLLYGRGVHRRNTYAAAVADWAGHVAAEKPPSLSCLQQVIEGKSRAEAFDIMGQAICAGFPRMAESDKISCGEIKTMLSAMEYWWGGAPADVVVQGHTDSPPHHWQACLPKAGVQRAPWPGGDGELMWESLKLKFLTELIELSKVVRASASSGEVLHPVEVEAKDLIALRYAIDRWGKRAAAAAGVGSEEIELSPCMRFWHAFACITAEYETGGDKGPADQERGFQTKRWAEQQAAPGDFRGTGWLYAQMLIQIREAASKAKTGFSLRKMEKRRPGLRPLEGKSLDDSRAMVTAYLADGREAWKPGGHVAPRALAAAIAADHVFVGHGLDALLTDVRQPTQDERLAIRFLEPFAKREKELWDDLFERHARLVVRLAQGLNR